MTPCSTLEQRWSACRARVYVAADWGAQWGDTPRLDMFSCTIWREREIASHRRPCTSPGRHQCKSDFWFPFDTQDTYCDDRPDKGPDPGVKGWDY